MKKQIRLVALTLIGALGAGFIVPTAAHAGSKGRRNTALLLGAVAAYGIVKKKPAVAGVAGAGAIYTYLQSRKAAKNERERERTRRAQRRARRAQRARAAAYPYRHYAPRPAAYSYGSYRPRPARAYAGHAPRGNAYGYWKKHRHHDDCD